MLSPLPSTALWGYRNDFWGTDVISAGRRFVRHQISIKDGRNSLFPGSEDNWITFFEFVYSQWKRCCDIYMTVVPETFSLTRSYLALPRLPRAVGTWHLMHTLNQWIIQLYFLIFKQKADFGKGLPIPSPCCYGLCALFKSWVLFCHVKIPFVLSWSRWIRQEQWTRDGHSGSEQSNVGILPVRVKSSFLRAALHILAFKMLNFSTFTWRKN